MDKKERPGVLTALAVINFVFAAFSLLGILGTIISKAVLPNLPMDQIPAEKAVQLAALQNMDTSVLVFMICTGIITFILLLLSGIGYLKLKRILGRLLGNIYGVFVIIASFVGTAITPEELGGGWGIMKIFGLVYPILTLILLNTVFRKILVE